jgi:hypothetical protein
MAKFSDAVKAMKVGQVVYTPSPLALPEVDRIKVKLADRNDKGLCRLDVSWHGVRLGTLYGKPDGAMAGWRFDDNDK